MQAMIKLANYCEAQTRACLLLAEASSNISANKDNSDPPLDFELAKEVVQKMLEATNLSGKEYESFQVVGLNVATNNVVNDRVSIADTCMRILRGILECYSFEFSGILSTTQYNSKFGLTTEFELASLNASTEIISNQPLRPADSFFRSGNCSICKKRYKNISLRNSLRRHICKSCGQSCCSTCCSAKVFDDRINDYVDVCTQCALT